MMRSMFAGIAGLRAHQTMMDVVGNNIANVNTAGYKGSQVTFQEALTQIMRGPGESLNPLQFGLGVKVASIDPVFSQGATQVTGRSTDLALQGDGFFVTQRGDQRLYTRAGAFSFDGDGNLVTPNGFQVLGWTADTTGAVDPGRPVGPISMPVGQVIEPSATGNVTIGGNLSADAPVGFERNTSIVVYDSLGNAHEVAISFTKSADNTWDVAAEVAGAPATMSPAQLTFGTDGLLTTSPAEIGFSGFSPAGADPMAFTIHLDGASPLVQFGGESSAEPSGQDGRAKGVLNGFAIGDDGSVTGQFSNGETKVLGMLATAIFANPGGLVKVGNSQFSSSTNSGDPIIGQPGSGGRGSITAGALEMSNVDLAQEFTNLIIAQRGFQANSRVITASDELLTDLVNLKR